MLARDQCVPWNYCVLPIHTTVYGPYTQMAYTHTVYVDVHIAFRV